LKLAPHRPLLEMGADEGELDAELVDERRVDEGVAEPEH
jgi:hypothetical protein